MGRAAAVVQAAGEERVLRALRDTASDGVYANYLQLLGLREQADTLGTTLRRRGAGRSELLRLCRLGALQRWELEMQVQVRPWTYEPRRAFGEHPAPARSDVWAAVDGRAAAALAAHTEACPAALAARDWWLQHWQQLAQAEPAEGLAGAEKTPGPGFLWCFGKPANGGPLVLAPDLKHPDHRKALQQRKQNRGQGAVHGIEFCIVCRQSGSGKCHCPPVESEGAGGRRVLRVGGVPCPAADPTQ